MKEMNKMDINFLLQQVGQSKWNNIININIFTAPPITEIL